MAPSGPRGLRGWLGAMFGHGGAAVPTIRPLEIQKTNGIRSRVGSEWAKGGVRMGLWPIRTPLCRAGEVAGTPRTTVPTICAVRLVLKVKRTGL